LAEALSTGKPGMFNSDQCSQFTGDGFTGALERRDISESAWMGREATTTTFIKRLWCTVKYEEVYLKAYRDGREARATLTDYFHFYNNQRPHQALGYRTPRRR